MNRIPKIFHYCWFGDSPLPTEYECYIEEWKLLHPDWTFKFWNDQNFLIRHSYCEVARKERNWANLSNFCRLWALKEEGGVYLDIDLKLLKPIDHLLEQRCFLAFEEGSADNEIFWVNNAVLGAEISHPFILKCFEKIETEFDGTEEANLSSPALTTSVLIAEYGLVNYGQQRLRDDILLLKRESFYPISWKHAIRRFSYEKYISEETLGVHMWGRTWYSKEKMIGVIDELQDWAFTLENEIERLQNTQEEKRVSGREYLDLLKRVFMEDRQEQQIPTNARVSKLEAEVNALRNTAILNEQRNAAIESKNRILEQTLVEREDLAASRIQNLEKQLAEMDVLLEELKTQGESKSRMMDGLQSTVRILAEENIETKRALQEIVTENEGSKQAFQGMLMAKEQVIVQLQSSIEWYQRTFENRNLLGIIKDRLKRTKPTEHI